MDRRSRLAHIRTTAEMMGVTLAELADLAVAAADDVDVPTVADFYGRVEKVESAKRGWDKRGWLFRALVERFGDQALETGARRGGAFELRVRDLHHDAREVALFEKGDIERKQPCSTALLAALAALATQRGATEPGDHVFQYLPLTRKDPEPRPLTKKYVEQLLTRIRQELPWGRGVWLRMHDLRHTAITNIERISGSTAVARLFAGHADRQTTDTYDRATERELRAAVDVWAGDLQA